MEENAVTVKCHTEQCVKQHRSQQGTHSHIPGHEGILPSCVFYAAIMMHREN